MPKHQKLLREHYKTYDGASKRARSENGLAPGDFSHGRTPHRYHFRVVGTEGDYRVERYLPEFGTDALAR